MTLLAVALAVTAGCDQTEASAQKTAPVPADQMIKRIQDDPHMPADQKAAAIARLQTKSMPDSP